VTGPHSLIVAVALLVPLALDTFVASTALGLAGLPRERRLPTSLTLAAFEAGMPIVGMLLGRGVGSMIGPLAGYAAAAAIGLAGGLLLRPGSGDGDEDVEHVRLLARAQGLAIINLGIGISIDELAIGLSLGLLGVPLALVVAFLAVQAFTASQLGLRLGSRIDEELREGAERAAGVLLILTALLLFALEAAGYAL
jgi:putative Mn2+ efflux pump MntP